MKDSCKIEVCKETAELLLQSEVTDTVRQQGLYLLSLLPNDGKSRHLHSGVLNRMLPYKQKIYDILLPDFVQKSDSYRTGDGKTKGYSKTWKYAKKPKSLATYEITNPNLLKKLETYKEDRDKRSSEYADHSLGTNWLVSSVERLSPSYVSDELMSREGLSLDSEKEPNVSPHTGRISHPFTQLPSHIRQNYLLDSEDVAEVDMAKSQIAIISKFWTHDREERERLQSYILDGTVYSRLEFAMEQDREKIKAWNLTHSKDPIKTTKNLMAKMLMGFQISDWKTHAFLKSEFPLMMRSIAGFKWKVQEEHGQQEALRKFALKLQEKEAYILAQAAERCSGLSIPAVPIFDGVLVPRSKAETVRDLFVEVLTERLGFAPEPAIDTTADERVLAAAI